MADYNIYIHSYGQYDSPTTPFQTRAESDTSGVGGEGGGSGGSGFGAVRRSASFISDAKSMISEVLNSNAGALLGVGGAIGLAGVAAKTAYNLVDKTVSTFNTYIHAPSGEFKYQIRWDNFKQNLHNIFHPISAEFERERRLLEMRNQNLKSEQERLLMAGTVYNSRYGRYL